jgi:hypothetical protein
VTHAHGKQADTTNDADPREMVGEKTTHLRHREDEDEIEEQLEWRNLLLVSTDVFEARKPRGS